MQERERFDREPATGAGDFTDWDNPEDWDEEEEFYDEDFDPEDGSYIPTPDDPDYDLSEVAGYSDWEAPERYTFELPRWLLVGVSILLALALLIPVWVRIA